MISLIACKARNNVIGKDGNIPWHIKEDFIHFKKYTMGKKVIMGRSTFVSINEKPLPNRENIVLTKNKEIYKDRTDIIVINSLDEILNKYKNSEEELVIMGGESVYKQALPFAKKIVLSVINKDYEGDTYFPLLPKEFKVYDVVHFDEFDVNYYKRNDE